MSGDLAQALLRRTPLSPARVREIPVPPAGRALSTLARIDYEDGFVIDPDPARDRTGEQWARAILEGAPLAVREALSRGWAALGLRLGPARSEELVLGWEVKCSTPDFALLAAGSRLGFSAELLVERRQDAVLFCTFVQHHNRVGRLLWTGLGAPHRQVVHALLERAA